MVELDLLKIFRYALEMSQAIDVSLAHIGQQLGEMVMQVVLLAMPML